MTRLEWLKERQSGIGGSDAPNILNIGFGSPNSVYQSKVNPVNDTEPKGILRRGLDLETIIAGHYTEVMGQTLCDPPTKIIRHPDRHWQLASLDKVVDGNTKHSVELKSTTGFGDEWGESGSSDVPEGYRIQCTHQMGVAGSDYCDLIALDVIRWEPRVYRLMFDPSLFELLTEIEKEFWGHVQSRSGIPEDWDSRIASSVKRICVPNTSVQLPEDLLKLVESRQEMDGIKKEADAEYKRLSRILENALGEAEVGYLPGYKIKRTMVRATRVEAFDKEAYSYVRITAIKPKKGITV